MNGEKIIRLWTWRSKISIELSSISFCTEAAHHIYGSPVQHHCFDSTSTSSVEPDIRLALSQLSTIFTTNNLSVAVRGWLMLDSAVVAGVSFWLKRCLKIRSRWTLANIGDRTDSASRMRLANLSRSRPASSHLPLRASQ